MNQRVNKFQNKFEYLYHLISELEEDKKYILPVFILKTQIIEYSLKYILAGHPEGSLDDKVAKWPMGSVIGGLEKLANSDTHLEGMDHLLEIVELAKQVNIERNQAIHHFLTSYTDLKGFTETLIKEIDVINKLEQSVNRYFLSMDALLLDNL